MPDYHGKYRGNPETRTIELAQILGTKPIQGQTPAGPDFMTAKETRLAHARAMRNSEFDLAAAQQTHQEYETERLAVLYAEEEANPDEFCIRVEPLPTDGVCTHCWTKGMLVAEEHVYFTTVSCMTCGADYFPNAEPIPLSEAPRPGRHNETLPGEHHLEYDEEYRKNRKRTKDA